MKIYRFERKQNIPIPINEAWDFFSNPANLSRITPQNMGFKIIYPVETKMYAGQVITYKVKPVLGIPLTWVTEITQVNEPYFFIDEQRFGPYKFWHHQHIFTETDGGIEMKDIIHYAIPAGFLGRIMNKLLIKNQLKSIFDYRFDILKNMFF